MDGDLKHPPGLARVALFGLHSPEAQQGGGIAGVLLQGPSVEHFRLVELLLMTMKIAGVGQEFEIIGHEGQSQFISRPCIIGVALGSQCPAEIV